MLRYIVWRRGRENFGAGVTGMVSMSMKWSIDNAAEKWRTVCENIGSFEVSYKVLRLLAKALGVIIPP